MIAVPTTAGTGSELRPFAVLKIREKVKGPIAGNALYPTHAVVDPELTHGLPCKVTVATGLDALEPRHRGLLVAGTPARVRLLAIEARGSSRQSQAGGRTARTRPGASAMSLAATLAGRAFQLPKNAMVHACSFPLSAAITCRTARPARLTLEEAIRFKCPAMGERMTRPFLQGIGLETAEREDLTRWCGELKRLGGLPCTLRRPAFPRPNLILVGESFHPLMRNNAHCDRKRPDRNVPAAGLRRPANLGKNDMRNNVSTPATFDRN